MGSLAIRPRFSRTIGLEVEQAQARILREVERGDDRCEVRNFPGFICLRIPEAERHFWSPRLMLSLDRAECGKTNLVGLYGPNANMWSLFLYGYLTCGTLSFQSASCSTEM